MASKKIDYIEKIREEQLAMIAEVLDDKGFHKKCCVEGTNVVAALFTRIGLAGTHVSKETSEITLAIKHLRRILKDLEKTGLTQEQVDNLLLRILPGIRMYETQLERALNNMEDEIGLLSSMIVNKDLKI